MKRLLLISALLVAGCTVEPDPFTPLKVTGTVTQAGQPAPAIVQLLVGQNPSGRIFPDGTYEVTTGGGGIPESSCSDVSVRAQLLSADLMTVLGEQTRVLNACGDHVVDFVFP